MIAMALVDGAGDPLWVELNQADPTTFAAAKSALGKMPAAVVDKIFQAVQEHNGMNADDDAVEGMAGN